MKFTKDTGTKFFFDEEDESQGFVVIKLLNTAEIEKIEKSCVKFSPQAFKGQIRDKRTCDDKKYFELTYDAIILNWDNVELDGEVIECNLANKAKMMRENNLFASFIIDCLAKLTEMLDEKKSNLEKN